MEMHQSQQETQNISSQNHNLAPIPIKGRSSHTFDLSAFLHSYEKLKNYPRAATDSPLNEKLWQIVQDHLSSCQDSITYEESESSDQVVAKGPHDIQSFVERVIALSLFNPIYPHRLAEHTGIPIGQIITELLYATKVGMMSMRWSPTGRKMTC